MTDSNTLRPLTPAAVKAMLVDGGELALIDVREELIFSRNHLLWARNVPLSRLELRFARLVPRLTTRIVLCDDNDGLVARAADILARAGYSDISYLDGGVAAWEAAGLVTFSGMHVPSKAFGEFIEHDRGTPSIGASELDGLLRAGTDLKVLDSRPFDEYARVSIPTATNVPGAELVLRVRDIVPSPATTIVVNCAGRTRSIIGAQSLIDAGVPNKVVALRNGTMGWQLAGLTCDSGKAVRASGLSNDGLAWARSAADTVARKFAVERIDRAMLERWRHDVARTTYVFDVRDPAEYEAGHLPGALSAPGGQLVQATDAYAGTLQARIVLTDDKEVRALMTAAWLKQMGWRDVVVLPQAGQESTRDRPAGRSCAGRTAAGCGRPFLGGDGDRRRDRHRPVDAARTTGAAIFPAPGSPSARGSTRAFANIPLHGEIVLTSEDGVLAGLAVAEARALTTRPVHWLQGGNAAWAAAGFPLSTDIKMADEPVDVWLKPYERPGDPRAAMNEYLSWEVDLLERIEQDGTCRFSSTP